MAMVCFSVMFEREPYPCQPGLNAGNVDLFLERISWEPFSEKSIELCCHRRGS
jgi:hypothetical protein